MLYKVRTAILLNYLVCSYDSGHQWTGCMIGRDRFGKRKMKIDKQRTLKTDLDGSSFDLNHNNKILKSDWRSYLRNWTVRAITARARLNGVFFQCWQQKNSSVGISVVLT